MLDLANLGPIIDEALAALRGQPKNGLLAWAIEPRGVLQSMSMARDVRSAGTKGATAARRGDLVTSGSFARRIGAVGIVPVYGPLLARRSRDYWSYDEIAEDMAMMAGMEDISAIVMDVNSPGGLASGIEVADEAIKAAKSVKPVVSFIDGYGASAAYWLASAADSVTASVSSLVGSVGSVISYVELDGILTNLGARKIEILSEVSPNKRLDPESEEGRAELQAITDDGGERFIEALAANRGVDRRTLLETYGRGLVFPAREAARRAMVDEITTLESLVAQLAERPPMNRNAGSATASEEEHDDMSDPKKAGAAAEQKAPDNTITQAALDRAVADATEAGAASGATAERERVAGLLSLIGRGHDDLVKAAIEDGKSTKADAALAILEAVPATQPQARASDDVLARMDKAAEGVNSTPSATGEGGSAPRPKAATPEGWHAEWEASEALQAEFATAQSYVAFMRAEASGKVRILGRK